MSIRLQEIYCGMDESMMWEEVIKLQGIELKTCKGLSFTYTIKGGEMFVDRKEKSITRSTIRIALNKVLELQEQGLPITGPKKLGVFGASYIYPIFQKIGIIVMEEKT